MTCDPKLLSYYRDGALGLPERYDVECHLATCASCTSELRGLMRLAQTIRSMPLEPVDPRLGKELRRRIAVREQDRRQRVTVGGFGRLVAPVAVAASIAASLVISFGPGGFDPLGVRVPAGAPASVAIQAEPPGSSNVSAARPPAGSNPPVAQPPIPRTGNPVATLVPETTEPAPVPAPIAKLYSSSRQVRDLLGQASPGSRTVTLLEQSFQGGLAIWRSDTREIYVLRRDGNSWSTHSDTLRPGDKISVDTPPPPGAMVPSGGFGSVWRSTPELQKRLGWAVYAPRGSGGLIQTFEHGLIVWTPNGLLYVLSSDGRWRTFPDATAV
jgi:anti-sigma factor RsiW